MEQGKPVHRLDRRRSLRARPRRSPRGGAPVKDGGYAFDLAYTSVLKRAIRTLWIALDELDQMWLPVISSWRLNERHYGALQGLNKGGNRREARRSPGEDLAPQLRHSAAADDPRRSASGGPRPALQGSLARRDPLTESLKDTVERFLPYWHEAIAPSIRSGKRVLIAAHGNSLRALVKYLDNISDGEIVELNIPTGIPLVYELDDQLKPLRNFYLGDARAAEKLRVAAQSSARK